MLQLENKTPFAAKIALFPNQHSIDTLYLIVKASFYIADKWTLLEEQIEPIDEDIYYGEPETSSLKYASDFHIGKPGTDIIMNGLACSPGKEKVKQLDVGLQVASLHKTISVFGDREWIDGKISSPKPFTSMPMVYEKSFGGMHIIDGEIDSADERNPVGCGFAGSRKGSEMNGVPLPNLEDPAQLIRNIQDIPYPAGFGFISPAWKPRSDYVGTYDDLWQANRAPYLPKDFDSRFLNMAHPDLVATGYLKGGEPVEITGMHPSGKMQFNLPSVGLKSNISIQNAMHSPEFNLETVLLEPNLVRLSMVWRASLPCDKKSLKIKRATISLRR
jgi:hypothetical protein